MNCSCPNELQAGLGLRTFWQGFTLRFSCIEYQRDSYHLAADSVGHPAKTSLRTQLSGGQSFFFLLRGCFSAELHTLNRLVLDLQAQADV